MRRAMLLVATVLAAAAGCDFDTGYDHYCAAHPGACVDGGTGGGTGAGLANQVQLIFPNLTLPASECVTSGVAIAGAGFGAGLPLPAGGTITVGAAPSVGLGLYSSASCTGASIGPPLVRSVAAGSTYQDVLNLRADRAGQYQLSIHADVIGVADTPPTTLNFPAQLGFVGIPTQVGSGLCVGPVRLMLQLDGGPSIPPNGLLTATVTAGDGVTLHGGPGCAVAISDPVFDLNGGGFSSAFYFLASLRDAGTLTATAGIHTAATLKLNTVGPGGGALCLAQSEPCLTIDAGYPCCAGFSCSDQPALGHPTCN